MRKRAWSWIAILCVLLCPAGLYARGGGGCVEEGTPVLTPNGPVAIEQLAPGDKVVSFRDVALVAGGHQWHIACRATVQAVLRAEPEEYVELSVAGSRLRVTPDHPISVGRGVFRLAGDLRAGVELITPGGPAQAIESAVRVRAARPAYNLLVSPGGTYFAAGVLVHNKGCFLPDTPILRADGGETRISAVRRGDELLAFRADGTVVSARVREILKRRADGCLVVTTERVVLRVTPEHPFYVGEGTFKTIESLTIGDSIFAWDGKGLSAQRIRDITRVAGAMDVYNLQTDDPHTFFAAGVAVHNKGGGCFLADTPILRADGKETPIRDVRRGDDVLAFHADGSTTRARVREIFELDADEYLVVTTPRGALRVTPEHPFYVGDGTFRTIESLAAGDRVFAWDGRRLSPQRILRIERVNERAKVYNLQTDGPHTFFAGGLAVHNKGGGCFPAGTRILTPSGERPIESLLPGDAVVAVMPDGRATRATLLRILAQRDALLTVETDRGRLVTTAEHPLLSSDARFRLAGELKVGDRIFRLSGGSLEPATVLRLDEGEAGAVVFNLEVSGPHTFVADGFVVHNKGGGSGGHGGGGGDAPPLFVLIFFGVVGGLIIVGALHQQHKQKSENLDYSFSRGAIRRKADKTQKLVEFIARTDPTFNPAELKAAARVTFVKLQECWEARDYGPMRPLMMQHLWEEHNGQIKAMISDHEINRIANLEVKAIDIVNVRYTAKPEQREFTALITASARDYYVDDRTNALRRGDDAPAQFQEFWTFHLQDGKWLLREIEQTRESDVLKEENFFEPFTDQGVKDVYGKEAGEAGPIGPWLAQEEETKATRIDRMLNFLVQTDKLWDRTAMLEGARHVFLSVHLAEESGDPKSVPADDLFPDAAEALAAEISRRKAGGIAVSYRNLCVRKVELIHVRNMSDNRLDEFTVRISAHAQKGLRMHSGVVTEQEYVTPFVEFWTFGRLDNRWKLKEVVPEMKGQQMLAAENVDQDSSPSQVRWYYKQTRAV